MGNKLIKQIEKNNKKGITTLDIHGKGISDLPGEIGEIGREIVILSAGHNNLSDLPDQIGDMESLTSLNVSQNKLTELPSTITRLRQLTRLNVAYVHTLSSQEGAGRRVREGGWEGEEGTNQ